MFFWLFNALHCDHRLRVHIGLCALLLPWRTADAVRHARSCIHTCLTAHPPAPSLPHIYEHSLCARHCAGCRVVKGEGTGRPSLSTKSGGQRPGRLPGGLMCELRASGWGRVWVGAGTLAAARAWRRHSMGYGTERTQGSRGEGTSSTSPITSRDGFRNYVPTTFT